MSEKNRSRIHCPRGRLRHEVRIFSVLLAAFALSAMSLFAQIQRIPSGFANGQAAHIVIGQLDYTNITGGTNQVLLRSLSGIAIAGNKLIVADSSYLVPDNNNRILIYNNLEALKTRPPQDDVPPADVVVGQLDFFSSLPGTSSQALNEPVGVATDGVRLFVADWGNNRILIYNTIPETNGAAADVVVGQVDFNSSNFGAGPQGLRRPNSVWSDGSRMMIADTLNNRILIYNTVPTQNNAAASFVVGQADFNGSQALPTAANTLSSPMSATTDGQRLIVTDLVNNRVLIYNSIPTRSGAAADVVVGQPNFTSNSAGNTQTSLNYPRYAYSDGTRLVIVDSGNNRILIYNQIPTQNGAPADVVIGQTDFYGLLEACAASSFAFPYSVASDGDMIYVTDGFDRRILGFRPGPSVVNLYGVVNTASFSTMAQTQACAVTLPQPPLAPGGLASIFGTNMADTTAPAPSLPLPTTLGGVSVTFNGIPAPLSYVSPTQINVQVPFELEGTSASMEIDKTSSTGTVVSAAVPVGLANGAPGIFSLDGSGTGPGVIVHGADFSAITADSPALPGETVTAFVTGLGTVDNVMEDGAAAVFGATGSVTIGGDATTAGQVITITVDGVPYSYTTVANDTLDNVTANLITVISSDPNVLAHADVTTADQVDLTARVPGAPGLSITYNSFVSPGATVTVTVNNPVLAPGFITFSGTAQANNVVTVTIAGTQNYQYLTVAGDTVESVIDSLVSLMSADPDVVATADIPDSMIQLSLTPAAQGTQISYSVSVQPGGSTLVAVTQDPQLLPGLANAVNPVTVNIGKGLPLVPGTISFGGTLEPGQTVTVTVGTTPYTYTTIVGDSYDNVVSQLTNLINGNTQGVANSQGVVATADLVNLQIDLALQNTSSSAMITFQTSLSPGATLIVIPQSSTSSGSEAASVGFAGLVPGAVGLYQVNFAVPTDQLPNTAADVTFEQNLVLFGSNTGNFIVSNDVTFVIGAARSHVVINDVTFVIGATPAQS